MSRERIEANSLYTPEPSLRELRIVKPGQKILEITRILDKHGAEGWIYGYEVTLGRLFTPAKLFIKEKNMISIGMPPTETANSHLNAFTNLARIGIPIPRTYGVFRGALYQDLIVNDGTDQIYGALSHKERLNPEETHALQQLATIASKLDLAGYPHPGFTGDLLYDAKRKKFFYIDAGFDLGSPSTQPNNDSLRKLITKFHKHELLILRLYENERSTHK